MAGRVNWLPVVVTPKKFSTILSIKYERNVITSPISAATIMFLADSTPALSPPEVIHLMPPKTRKARQSSEATMNATVIAHEKRSPLRVILQRLEKLLLSADSGQKLIFIGSAANAGKADIRYTEAVKVKADTFFMYILILRGFLMFVKYHFYA
jgi:hypothetical protein